MKELKIIYADTFSEEIRAEMKSMGVKGYSIIPEVLGKGLSTEPKFNNHVWPGKNMLMYIICDDESAVKVMERMNKLRGENPNEGIFGWASDVSDLTEHDKTNII